MAAASGRTRRGAVSAVEARASRRTRAARNQVHHGLLRSEGGRRSGRTQQLVDVLFPEQEICKDRKS